MFSEQFMGVINTIPLIIISTTNITGISIFSDLSEFKPLPSLSDVFNTSTNPRHLGRVLDKAFKSHCLPKAQRKNYKNRHTKKGLELPLREGFKKLDQETWLCRTHLDDF